MLLKNYMHMLWLIMVLLLYTATDSHGSVTDVGNWQELASQTLYFLDTDQCPTPSWLQNHQQLLNTFEEPELRKSVRSIESFLEQAMESRR